MPRITSVCFAALLVSSVVSAKEALPIHVEIDHGAVLYELSNVRGNIDKLLDTLRRKAVPNQEVLDHSVAVVLANKNVSIADLQNLRSLLQQYGFLDIRFFTYWDDKKRMSELTFGKNAVPFTGDASELKRLIENP